MVHAQNGTAVLHYEVSGSGTAVVMLVPQSSGPAGRRELHAGLAKQHAVITYDQRGTGASSPVSSPMSMTQQAADVVAVLDHASVASAHLFCHSTGCGIGLALTAAFKHRVASVCLVNPWTYGDTHLRDAQRLRIAAAKALAPEPYARFNAALLFPPDYRRAHEAGFAKLYARAALEPHDASAIERRLEAILAFDARPLLPTITQPVAVVSARDDQLMPEWFAAAACTLLPDATALSLNGGGHMLTETRTAEVLRFALALFAQVDAPANGINMR